jgi:hypothetical protein
MRCANSALKMDDNNALSDPENTGSRSGISLECADGRHTNSRISE